MEENQTREILARLAGHEGPPLGFTADSLAARGRRHARTRRIGATAGGAVGVVAVAVAVLPGMAPKGSGTVDPNPATTPSRGASPAEGRACVADMAGRPEFDGDLDKTRKRIALEMCPLLRRMDAVLDPQGTHLTAVDDSRRPAPIDVTIGLGTSGAGMADFTTAEASDSWTADGHYPNTSEHPMDVFGIFTDVRISVLAPAAPDPLPYGGADHLAHPGLKPGQAPPAVPWGPARVTPLPDGSTLSVRGEADSGGKRYLLVRTMPSGMRLALLVDGPFGNGPSGTPFPFDEARLTAAVSVPWDGVIDLPAPTGMPPLPKTKAQADHDAAAATTGASSGTPATPSAKRS